MWIGEGVPGPHPRVKFHRCRLQNVSLQSPKSRKMVGLIFGINLPLRENSGGPHKKLNIDAQLQTFLYAMTPIVLKITLLLSVSVITNFVIPKREKQTKNITLYRLQPERDPQSPPYLA